MSEDKEARIEAQLGAAHALAAMSNDLACLHRPNPSPEALSKVADFRAATYSEVHGE